MSSGRTDDLTSVRTDDLFGLFNNWHRAIVVETNDPLNMGRVRFKCPELHDEDLKDDDCPWALPSPRLGGPRAGSWNNPCKGDIVFVCWEEGHVYSPIWSAAADPTRRKSYPLPSVHIVTPVPVDERGEPLDPPSDYDERFLAKDSRPMKQGVVDRYGNMDVMSAIGFFPVEHEEAPPDSDYDALQKRAFEQTQEPPAINEPDSKYMVRMSKYGHLILHGDQGYWWKREKDSDFGEFYGDWEKDEDWEEARWKYIQQLVHEDSTYADQRRMMFLTRYGHKFELRDTGWAQPGPKESKTREGEYSDPRYISKEEEQDYRWIKLRTKGGMLFQMYDKGFDPKDDEFVSRKLLDEVGALTEQEDVFWKEKDSRWIRFITRHGFKIVMDDRGSDEKSADIEETPRGNGILIKGRRSPSAQGYEETKDDERGFYWEFNENDATNQTTWGSPLGITAQISDKVQYFMVAAARREYAMEYRRHEENEFLREPLVSEDTETLSHHLKIDHHNEYIRFKTRAGYGPAPWGEQVNYPAFGEQQGVEARDGTNDDGAWCELVDIDRRGVWFSKKFKLSVFRGSTTSSGRSNMLMWFDEGNTQVVLRNNEAGFMQGGTFIPARLQIYCKKDVEIIAESGSIKLSAYESISLQSKKITMVGGGARLELSGGNPKMIGAVMAPDLIKVVPTIRIPRRPIPIGTPQKVQPADRGRKYNEHLEEPAPDKEIEHPIEEE